MRKSVDRDITYQPVRVGNGVANMLDSEELADRAACTVSANEIAGVERLDVATGATHRGCHSAGVLRDIKQLG